MAQCNTFKRIIIINNMKPELLEIANFNNLSKSRKNGQDPDKYCRELGEEHCRIWNKQNRFEPLKWNPYNRLSTTINGVEYVLTPDSITNSFRHSKIRVPFIDKTEEDIILSFGDEVKELITLAVKNDYTIGSSLIFPISIDKQSIKWTMNIARGLSNKIHDRIDYTLECIKRYYDGNKDNPLQSALEKSDRFFRLFNGFDDYVNYFFLNDLLDNDGNVVSFTDKIDFNNPFPKEKEEYIKYIENTLIFVIKRNKRMMQKI